MEFNLKNILSSWMDHLLNLVSISNQKEDLFSNVNWLEEDNKFLGDYSIEEIEQNLEKFGIFPKLREAGFNGNNFHKFQMGHLFYFS